jgi:hypothetical protein
VAQPDADLETAIRCKLRRRLSDLAEVWPIRAQGREGNRDCCDMFLKDKRQMADGSELETERIWFKVVYVFD